jgi:hypothetical protein
MTLEPIMPQPNSLLYRIKGNSDLLQGWGLGFVDAKIAKIMWLNHRPMPAITFLILRCFAWRSLEACPGESRGT